MKDDYDLVIHDCRLLVSAFKQLQLNNPGKKLLFENCYIYSDIDTRRLDKLEKLIPTIRKELDER